MTIRDVHAELDALGDIAARSDDDVGAGRNAYRTAVTVTTQTDGSRLTRAEQAYIAVAHYRRLAKLPHISDDARRFLLSESAVTGHIADMLLSDATEADITSLIIDLSGKPLR